MKSRCNHLTGEWTSSMSSEFVNPGMIVVSWCGCSSARTVIPPGTTRCNPGMAFAGGKSSCGPMCDDVGVWRCCGRSGDAVQGRGDPRDDLRFRPRWWRRRQRTKGGKTVRRSGREEDQRVVSSGWVPMGWAGERRGKKKVELGREGLFPVINAPERPEGSSRASHLPGNASTRQGEPRSALACQMARLP